MQPTLTVCAATEGHTSTSCPSVKRFPRRPALLASCTAAAVLLNLRPGDEAHALEASGLKETDSGLQYVDVKPGKGKQPQKGNLIVVQLVGRVQSGEVFIDTRARNKPIAFVYGGRPFATVCAGVMEGLSGMQAGGRRTVVVPPSLGFGEAGAVIKQATCDGVFCDTSAPPPAARVPPNATLEYDLELVKVTEIPAQMSR